MSHKKSKKRKPLQIWIRGEGLRVEATFTDVHLSQMLADALDHVAHTGKASTELPKEPHDFDVVQRVIAHADPAVLQAIVDLARHELDKRNTAS